MVWKEQYLINSYYSEPIRALKTYCITVKRQ